MRGALCAAGHPAAQVAFLDNHSRKILANIIIKPIFESPWDISTLCC
jgi:hypothetical protein